MHSFEQHLSQRVTIVSKYTPERAFPVESSQCSFQSQVGREVFGQTLDKGRPMGKIRIRTVLYAVFETELDDLIAHSAQQITF